MRDRKRTYGQPAISQWLGRRKALRRFPPFFMNNSEYRSLLNNKNGSINNGKSLISDIFTAPYSSIILSSISKKSEK